MSTVSVVIPCFNLGAFLPEAVDSVLAQTRPADELVVVDDGSDDPATLAALAQIERAGQRVLRQANGGASAARNAGIAATSGQHVLCLDADDVLLPSFLERAVERMDASPSAGIVAGYVEAFGESKGIWRPREHSLQAMLTQNCVPSASLFRRCCWAEVGGYADIVAGQDWDFFLAIVVRGWRWEVVPEVLYRYRRRSGSLSDYREAHREEMLRPVLARHEAAYREHLPDVIIALDAELTRLRARLRARPAVTPAPAAAAVAARPGIAALRARLAALEAEAGEVRLELARREEIAAIAAAVALRVPAKVNVSVISRGDDELLALGDRTATHFPADADGTYAGHHPADDDEALALLAQARARGCEYLVVPASERWWLEHYSRMHEHLIANCPVVHSGDRSTIFDVTTYHAWAPTSRGGPCRART